MSAAKGRRFGNTASLRQSWWAPSALRTQWGTRSGRNQHTRDGRPLQSTDVPLYYHPGQPPIERVVKRGDPRRPLVCRWR